MCVFQHKQERLGRPICNETNYGALIFSDLVFEQQFGDIDTIPGSTQLSTFPRVCLKSWVELLGY